MGLDCLRGLNDSAIKDQKTLEQSCEDNDRGVPPLCQCSIFHRLELSREHHILRFQRHQHLVSRIHRLLHVVVVLGHALSLLCTSVRISLEQT